MKKPATNSLIGAEFNDAAIPPLQLKRESQLQANIVFDENFAELNTHVQITLPDKQSMLLMPLFNRYERALISRTQRQVEMNRIQAMLNPLTEHQEELEGQLTALTEEIGSAARKRWDDFQRNDNPAQPGTIEPLQQKALRLKQQLDDLDKQISTFQLGHAQTQFQNALDEIDQAYKALRRAMLKERIRQLEGVLLSDYAKLEEISEPATDFMASPLHCLAQGVEAKTVMKWWAEQGQKR
ncbi:hypothetical protein EAN04_24535 [Salmonella enterica]|nr:hypothetical protein [Salmonella enterica]